MDEERKEILAQIEALRKETERINLRVQIFTEIISHLRSRVSKAETRKAQIHNEVLDLRARVLAWEAANKQDNKKD